MAQEQESLIVKSAWCDPLIFLDKSNVSHRFADPFGEVIKPDWLACALNVEY